MTNEEFMKHLGEKLSAEVHVAMPEHLAGYAQVSWDSAAVKPGAGLVRTIAAAVTDKNPDVKHIHFRREYDIEADAYTKHRVLFW